MQPVCRMGAAHAVTPVCLLTSRAAIFSTPYIAPSSPPGRTPSRTFVFPRANPTRHALVPHLWCNAMHTRYSKLPVLPPSNTPLLLQARTKPGQRRGRRGRHRQPRHIQCCSRGSNKQVPQRSTTAKGTTQPARQLSGLALLGLHRHPPLLCACAVPHSPLVLCTAQSCRLP